MAESDCVKAIHNFHMLSNWPSITRFAPCDELDDTQATQSRHTPISTTYAFNTRPLRGCTLAETIARRPQPDAYIAAALAVLQQDSWVEDIAQGLNTVSVLVQQPPVKHELKMKDFLSWLGRPGGSPAEVALRERVRKLLVKTNASVITKSR